MEEMKLQEKCMTTIEICIIMKSCYNRVIRLYARLSQSLDFLASFSSCVESATAVA